MAGAPAEPLPSTWACVRVWWLSQYFFTVESLVGGRPQEAVVGCGQLRGPSAGPELGAPPEEWVHFPAVWFTGLERPRGQLLW